MNIKFFKKVNKGKIKANFSLEICTGLCINGFSLIENKKGKLFVANPCFKYKDKYISHVFVDNNMRDRIMSMAMDEYDNNEQDIEEKNINKYNTKEEEDDFPF